MTKLVLFDVDGTLLLGTGLHVEAFKVAFKDIFNKDADTADIWGATDKLILKNAFEKYGIEQTQENFGKMNKCMIDYFQKQHLEGTKILPGVRDLLERLNEDEEILIGLETGNVKEIAFHKLKHLEIDNYFKKGGFGGEFHIRSEMIEDGIKQFEKEHGPIDRKDVFIIGDTNQDIIAAQKNDAKVIAVLTGRGKREELEKLNPDYIFDDLTDTKKIIETIKNG